MNMLGSSYTLPVFKFVALVDSTSSSPLEKFIGTSTSQMEYNDSFSYSSEPSYSLT